MTTEPQASLEVRDPVTSGRSEKLGPDRHLEPHCPIINIPSRPSPVGEQARLTEMIRAFWGRR